MDEVRVILWGLGAMGSGMARLITKRSGARIVGAIGSRKEKAGKDLGEVAGLGRRLGVIVTTRPEEALLSSGADLVLHSTASFTREVLPQILMCERAGLNVITVAEEMAYPWAEHREAAQEIDGTAKQHGVTVLGCGINPGFILDTLIISLTGVCEEVRRIRARRVNDLSPFGPTVMRTQGVGTTPEEFMRGLAEGSIVGHIGFRQSIGMIADTLGWKLDEIRETREPIISTVERRTPYVEVKPGMVAGCNHTAQGIIGGEPVIALEHPQQVLPGLAGVETGDYIWIEGTPQVNLSIKPEVPGGTGTIAVAVNMIPHVIGARPGLMTMRDLPVPTCAMGDLMELIKMRGGGLS